MMPHLSVEGWNPIVIQIKISDLQITDLCIIPLLRCIIDII